jgi:hypothetical protein
MNLEKLLDLVREKTGRTPKKTESGYSTCCPAHEDANPSLSIGPGNNQALVLHCFAGCSIEAICSSLGIELKDLFSSSQPNRTVYPYYDEYNRELYRKIRIEPGYNGKKKSFYLERTDKNGLIVKNLKGCHKVLYRLPEILKSISENVPIFLVEGEKDADKLFSLGLAATTSAESLFWSDSFSKVLQDADVVLLYDLDKTGLERRDLLIKKLYQQVKSLCVVDLPGLTYQESHGDDVSDWLARGHTTQELLEIVDSTPLYSHENEKIRAVSLGEFLDMNIPKREMLLSPFLPSQGLAMLYAKRGVGKTHVALGIAYAVVCGGTFLKWSAPKPRKVLYIDGEMPAIAMQDRLRRISTNATNDLSIRNDLILITPDLQDGSMPDLSTQEGRSSIDKFVEACDLIIIDNLSCLFRSGLENEAESWQPAQDWALELRKRGKSILFIHHANKSGNQRGTSKKEDILDAVLCLKQPDNYRQAQGARFEVHYEKTRHFSGEEAAPFHVQLREDPETGFWDWEITQAPIDPEVMTVAELTKEV